VPRLASVRAAAVVAFALAAAFAAGLSACAESGFVDGRDRGEWKDGAGTAVAWSPKKPAIGDLVHLEAALPAAGMDLKLPGGEAPQPIDRLYRSDGGVTIRWSFRVKAAGDYGLGATTLWSTASVAGQAAELKTHDSGALWSGKGSCDASPANPGPPSLTPVKRAPPVAPQSAPSPGAAPGASGGGASAVPQANT